MGYLITLLTLLLPFLAHASFNLNTAGPDWAYTAQDLANTTSPACRAAYSAEIDCDPTLLGLVASMRPGFQPTAADLDATCTDACRSSLETYIRNVQAACAEPGDRALEQLWGPCCTYTTDPVELVGQIFLYTLERDCVKDKYDIFPPCPQHLRWIGG